VTAGFLSIALALLVSAQPQQQKQDVPDAPAPQTNSSGTISDGPTPQTSNGLGDLRNQVAPGKAATPDSATGASSSSTQPSQAAPSASKDTEEAPEMLPEPGQGPVTTIKVPVNFVLVPVTVRDSKGHLVPGLTYRDFKVFENNQRQRLFYFSVDPFPLSIAFVIDQSLPSDTMRKVNDSLAEIVNALTPQDEVALFTYNNGVENPTDFTAAQSARLAMAIERSKKPGRDMGVAVNSGPLAGGPQINGHSIDPNLTPQRGNSSGVLTIPKEVHTLNDAMLAAAKATAGQEKGRRRVIYVISDGKEAGSKATYKEVVRFMLTNQMAVYGTLVGDSATWGVGYLDKIHIWGLPTNNILPKYALATGGTLDAEGSINGIEKSIANITQSIRFQYTLGYNSHQPVMDGKYRKIDIQVTRPNLEVIARDGYYPSAEDVKGK
jgi:VWFA-related protein